MTEKGEEKGEKAEGDEEEEEDESKTICGLLCRNCENTTCRFSAVKRAYSKCEECKTGAMLVYRSKADDLFAICNNEECCLSYKIGVKVKNFKLAKKCESCERRSLKVTLTPNSLVDVH